MRSVCLPMVLGWEEVQQETGERGMRAEEVSFLGNVYDCSVLHFHGWK